MPVFESSNWITVFLSGAVAIVLSWATSGCRWGNHTESQPKSDSYSGYYLTEPKMIKFYSTTTQPLEKEGSLTQIPAGLQHLMTNPIALVMDLKTGKAYLADTTLQHSLSIIVNSDHTLTHSSQTSNSTYWDDPDCQHSVEISEAGSFTQDSGLSSPTGTQFPIKGRVRLNIQIRNQFQGNCAPTFLAISDCYQDPSRCGGQNDSENLEMQTIIQKVFSPWIKAEIISPSDIPNLVNFAYEVFYE